MRIREYQLDKIEEARRIQQECLRLHLPCPPVLHWGYEIKDKSGNAVEIGRGKANSFTRNALNLLAYQVGMTSFAIQTTSYFADGWISFKNTAGAVPVSAATRYASASVITNINLGGGADPESLDSYLQPSSELSGEGNTQISGWDESSRKIVTTISRPFINNTASAVDVTEAAIRMNITSSAYLIMVRDVFSAITVQPGETITWTYTTEVAFPNP